MNTLAVFEMSMPEEDSYCLAKTSFELGTYLDELVECMVRYAATHPEEVKKWYRENNPKPYYVFKPYRKKKEDTTDDHEEE